MSRRSDRRAKIEQLRKAHRKATHAPWVFEAIKLDESGLAILKNHPTWSHNPWHTTVGWSDADRDFVQLVVSELPDLLDQIVAQEDALVEARACLAAISRNPGLLDITRVEQCLARLDDALEGVPSSSGRTAKVAP